jgi:hypothetical protein
LAKVDAICARDFAPLASSVAIGSLPARRWRFVIGLAAPPHTPS